MELDNLIGFSFRGRQVILEYTSFNATIDSTRYEHAFRLTGEHSNNFPIGHWLEIGAHFRKGVEFVADHVKCMLFLFFVCVKQILGELI